MFHPVGSQPPSVYWRRRLLAAGSLVILVVLLVVTISVASGSSGSPSGGSSSTPVAAGDASGHHSSTAESSSQTGRKTSGTPRTGSSSKTDKSPSTTAGNSSGSASLTVQKCSRTDLDIAAVVGEQSYRVGQNPTVELKVTNVGSAPCAQDLADKQVLLKVYNGVSRVWGSHDCQVQPGKKVRTLAVGAPVLETVSWSGETSQPGCAGTRQHVGAGTYTLYASLAGKAGTPARFTIS